MTFADARAAVLQLLQSKGRAKNSEMLQLVGGDAVLLEEVREDLIFTDLAEDKKGVGLIYVGSASPQPAEPAPPPPAAPPPAPAAARCRIYLSYAPTDAAEVAARLEHDLQAHGHPVRAEAGSAQALLDSDVVVALLTPSAVRRPDGTCLEDLRLALQQGRRALPVMASSCRPPLILGGRGWIDLRGWRDPESYQQALEQVVTALDRPEAVTTAHPRLHAALQPLDVGPDVVRLTQNFSLPPWIDAGLEAWLQREDSRVLFLTGEGEGSARSAVVAHLAHAHPQVVACYFLAPDRADSLDPSALVRTLAVQLATQLDWHRAALEALDLEQLAGADPRELLRLLVCDPLRAEPPSQPLLLLIDGLDDAPGTFGRDLAVLLAEGLADLPGAVRLVLGCRGEVEVLEPFGSGNPQQIDVDHPPPAPPSPPPADEPVPRSETAPAAEATVPYLSENVQFSVFQPRAVEPKRWHPLLAFAHLAELPADAGQTMPDPLEEVQRQAEQVLGEKVHDYRQSTHDSGASVPREGELTFLPEADGIEFNPPRRTFLWLENVHREEFRLRASPELEGQTAKGTLTVFLGNILLATVPLRFAVQSGAAARPGPAQRSSARPYRKIFASYSHYDAAIVEEFERYAQALGDVYLRDCTHLRAGEVWSAQIRGLIEEADVFQLFWSRNAMESPFVEREWSFALWLNRPNFIRPTYWEDPLPSSPERNLPPEDLRRLHFQRLRLEPPRGVGPEAARADTIPRARSNATTGAANEFDVGLDVTEVEPGSPLHEARLPGHEETPPSRAIAPQEDLADTEVNAPLPIPSVRAPRSDVPAQGPDSEVWLGGPPQESAEADAADESVLDDEDVMVAPRRGAESGMGGVIRRQEPAPPPENPPDPVPESPSTSEMELESAPLEDESAEPRPTETASPASSRAPARPDKPPSPGQAAAAQQPIAVRCLYCGKKVRVARGWLGRDVRCPHCESSFTATVEKPAPKPPPRPASTPGRPRSAPWQPGASSGPPSQESSPPSSESIDIGRAPPPSTSPGVTRIMREERDQVREESVGVALLRFAATVVADPEGKVQGKYHCEVTPEGLRLKQGSREEFIALGTPTEYAGDNQISVIWDLRRVELAISRRLSNNRRLAEDVVAFLEGKMDWRLLLPGKYVLPWYLLALLFLPLGLPALALVARAPGGGAGVTLWAGVGVGLAVACLLLVQRESWPAGKRLLVGLVLVGIGYLALLAALSMRSPLSPPPQGPGAAPAPEQNE